MDETLSAIDRNKQGAQTFSGNGRPRPCVWVQDRTVRSTPVRTTRRLPSAPARPQNRSAGISVLGFHPPISGEQNLVFYDFQPRVVKGGDTQLNKPSRQAHPLARCR